MKERTQYLSGMLYNNTLLPYFNLPPTEKSIPKSAGSMIHTALRRKIRSLCSISDEVFQVLNSGFKPFDLASNQILISPEQIPDRIFYIQKGWLRGYYMGEKETITTWFAGPDEFVIPNHFFSQQACAEYIQSFEDCTLLSLNHQTCLKMAMESNDIARICFKLLEEKQLNSDLREQMLRIPNAEKRYLNIIQLMPVLQQNVKDDILASYMNVTRRHLERLKIKNARK